MSGHVNKSELSKIPYLDPSALGDRVVNLMAHWDGVSWTIWVDRAGKLHAIQPVDAVRADYVARKPASDEDVYIPFVELIWQQASWPDICPLVSNLCNDIHNLGASLAKIEHFYDMRGQIGFKVARFVATEIEYIFVVARSLFDLLQHCIANLWHRRVQLLDAKAQRAKRQLPETFRKMVLVGRSDFRTSEQIRAEFVVPDRLAEAYTSIAPFFQKTLSARDALVHHGRAVAQVYPTEKGFCVDPAEDPYSKFDVWQESHRYNERLFSLKPLLAQVVFETIDACNKLMAAFAAQVEFPPPIAPGYHVFVRGQFNSSLARAKATVEGGWPWWTEPVVEASATNHGTDADKQ